MKISPDQLSDEAQTLARFVLEGRDSPLVHSDQLDEDVYRHASIRSTQLKSGQRVVKLSEIVEAPEHGSVYDGPSGESVALTFDSEGTLKSVRDIPVGYEARGVMHPLLDSIIPARRKRKEKQIVNKTETLIRSAARRLIEKQ
jgi:hypothetical protein